MLEILFKALALAWHRPRYIHIYSTEPGQSHCQETMSNGNPKSLTILSYNVGLLRFRMFGVFTVFSNPPYANQRLPHIPEALKSVDSDIIAIQECYEERHASLICEALKDTHPYSAREKSGGVIRFHNGLLLLSKYPIKSQSLAQYSKVSKLERYLATKSSLIVEVEIPGIGDGGRADTVVFVNMHTTAGGEADPEHPEADGDREDELREAVEACEIAAKAGSVGVIVGDLNCGPEASSGNFDYILQHGFRDTYAEAVAAGKLSPGPAFTWDPANYLNQIGPHAHCPGQRCDHLLLPTVRKTGTSASGTVSSGEVVPVADKAGGASVASSLSTSASSANSATSTTTSTAPWITMDDWAVERVQVVFEAQSVDIGKGLKSTLSDHHGLLITLSRK